MRTNWLVVFALLLAGCIARGKGEPQENTDLTPEASQTAPPATPVEVVLEDFGPAPELTNEVWLNVDRPLRLADLRGKVVLIEMWTFG